MTSRTITLLFLCAATLTASVCGASSAPKTASVRVTAVNPLNTARQSETLVLKWTDLTKLLPGLTPDRATVVDPATHKELVSQTIDLDGNAKPDQLIFQWDFKAKEKKVFIIKQLSAPRSENAKSMVFGRYVPERMDDFAWENDRVAFRMYGQALRKETISSGVDVWAKRVRSLVVNKWYAAGEYHTDKGEGLDCFSVGPSRGCGGLGIWKNDRMYLSDNYTTYKVLANGPIRTVFELTYAPWDADGTKISETKRITLDAGWNLNHFESTFTCAPACAKIQYAIGLVRRAGVEMSSDADQGWISLWGPTVAGKTDLEDLGTGVVVNKAKIEKILDSQGHALVIVNGKTGVPESYYAGFGWTRSGDFKNKQDWLDYLGLVAQRVAAPVRISISKG